METANTTQAGAERRLLIRIRNLKQYFPVRSNRKLFVKANDGIDLDIYEGETFGLVGESGCGKSTLGRVLLQLYRQTEGQTLYYGRTLDELAPQYVREMAINLSRRRREMREARARARQAQEELDALRAQVGAQPDNSELSHKLFVKMEECGRAQKRADARYLPLAQIFGGLLAVEDTGEVSRVYMHWYAAARALYDAREEHRRTELRYEAGKAKAAQKGAADPSGVKRDLAARLDRLSARMAEKEKALSQAHRAIDALRQKYGANPEFAEHDALLDGGIDLSMLRYDEMRKLRRDMQLIFQDPYSSLNPRLSVGQIIGEGLRTHNFFVKKDVRIQNYVMKVMEDCGLAPYMIHRYPHQFSGGQRQRIGIARSLAVSPKFVVCDEAVSALDVSIQSQILNLLQELRDREHLTYMFISHDLSVIKYISDRVGVMYLGNIVELSKADELFANPVHPYTEALLSAIPTTDAESRKKAILLEGDIPSPVDPPKGCKFHTRCHYATDICRQVTPDFIKIAPEHFVACHHRDRKRAGA